MPEQESLNPNPNASPYPYPNPNPNEGALAPAAAEQRWEGEEDAAFLGGFGSDFCSGDIDDASRNYLDRAEQIVIAAR